MKISLWLSAQLLTQIILWVYKPIIRNMNPNQDMAPSWLSEHKHRLGQKHRLWSEICNKLMTGHANRLSNDEKNGFKI